MRLAITTEFQGTATGAALVMPATLGESTGSPPDRLKQGERTEAGSSLGRAIVTEVVLSAEKPQRETSPIHGDSVDFLTRFSGILKLGLTQDAERIESESLELMIDINRALESHGARLRARGLPKAYLDLMVVLQVATDAVSRTPARWTTLSQSESVQWANALARLNPIVEHDVDRLVKLLAGDGLDIFSEGE